MRGAVDYLMVAKTKTTFLKTARAQQTEDVLNHTTEQHQPLQLQSIEPQFKHSYLFLVPCSSSHIPSDLRALWTVQCARGPSRWQFAEDTHRSYFDTLLLNFHYANLSVTAQ